MSSLTMITTNMANVVVIDNDKDRARGMVRAFDQVNGANAIHLWKDGRGRTQCSNHQEIPKQCNLLLWHVGDLAGDWGDITPNLLIYYGGNGGEDVRFPAAAQERIWRPIRIGSFNRTSGVLTTAEGQALLAYTDAQASGVDNIIAKPACLRQHCSYLPALAMLCQGYLATYSKYATSHQAWAFPEATDALELMKWPEFLSSGKLESWFNSTEIDYKKAAVSQPSWWLEGLGFMRSLQESNGEDTLPAYAACRTAVMSEWQQAADNTVDNAVSTLLSTIAKQDNSLADDVSLVDKSLSPAAVAAAYGAIAAQFPTLLCAQQSHYSFPEEDFTHIFTISACPISVATSTVMSLFLNAEILRLDEAISEGTELQLYKQSLLVISKKHLNRLADLRLRGFSGAVLVLSSDPIEPSYNNAARKYPILQWGQGSHHICTFPCTLASLLERVSMLFPMEPENLTLLQNQLKAPISWLEERVIPLLHDLQLDTGDHAKHLKSLDTIIQDLRTITPVVYHSIAEIDGESMQIQHHFKEKLANLKRAQHSDLKAISSLRQTFETWRDLTVEGSESQGRFSGGA